MAKWAVTYRIKSNQKYLEIIEADDAHEAIRKSQTQGKGKKRKVIGGTVQYTHISEKKLKEKDSE